MNMNIYTTPVLSVPKKTWWIGLKTFVAIAVVVVVLKINISADKKTSNILTSREMANITFLQAR